MKITFKCATKDDVNLIFQLAEKIWRKHYPDIITNEQIDYMLATMYSSPSLVKQIEEGQEFTIAYLDEVAVGFISVSEKGASNYFLHKFYVDVNQHRKGIGQKIWNHIEKNLKRPYTIELTVNRKNFKAINFYFKTGFIIDRIADFDIGAGYFMNDFVMKKSVL